MRTEKSSATAESIRAEMARRIMVVAWPFRSGETKERFLERAARKLGWPFGKTKRYAYQEIKVVPAVDADHLRHLTGCLEAWAEKVNAFERELEESRLASRQLELDLDRATAEAHRGLVLEPRRRLSAPRE